MGKLQEGFVHTVFFWLKENGNSDHKQLLLKGLNELSQISEIKDAYIGAPAGTRREVIDSTFCWSITFIFESAEDQDIYQTHPDHLKFIENYGHLWSRVQVYDAFGR